MAKDDKEKRAKFVELGEKRMTKAIAGIRGVRKLANKSAYDFTDAHAAAIVETLTNEVKALATDFKSGKVSGSTGFKLA